MYLYSSLILKIIYLVSVSERGFYIDFLNVDLYIFKNKEHYIIGYTKFNLPQFIEWFIAINLNILNNIKK